MRVTPFLLALVACDPATLPPPSGTSVGNPGKNVFRIAPGAGLVYATAEARDLSFELVGCDGTAEVPPMEVAVDLLDGEPVSFPGLEWCAVVVDASEIHVTGGGETESFPFDLTLAPPFPLTLWAGAPFAVDGDTFVLELGGEDWISAESLGIATEEVVVGPESEIHDQLLVPLVERSAWYLDEDDDGVVSADERSAARVAAAGFAPPPEMGETDTDEPPASVGVDGCNCATTRTAPAFPLLLLALFTRTRRRTPPG